MKAIRRNENVHVEIKGNYKTFSLLSKEQCEALRNLIGKQVYDILQFTIGEYVDCETLGVERK